jgi:hypothetical protein
MFRIHRRLSRRSAIHLEGQTQREVGCVEAHDQINTVVRHRKDKVGDHLRSRMPNVRTDVLEDPFCFKEAFPIGRTTLLPLRILRLLYYYKVAWLVEEVFETVTVLGTRYRYRHLLPSSVTVICMSQHARSQHLDIKLIIIINS